MALKEIKVDGKNFMLSYEIINPYAKKEVIFLHGWGSNKEVMKVFKNDLKEYKQIYLDLPGFGKSENSYVLDTKEYAKITDAFLKEIGAKKDLIIAHSFGGKVGLLLNPKKIVLLASAGILEKKPLSVKIKIKIFKILKNIGLKKVRNFFVSNDAKGMSENMYETFKRVVNEDFSEVFKKFKGEVLIFGAKKDTAVSKEAIKKQAKLLNSNFIMLNGDHYFFLDPENRKTVVKKIIEFDR